MELKANLSRLQENFRVDEIMLSAFLLPKKIVYQQRTRYSKKRAQEKKFVICVQLTVKCENGIRMGERIDRREKKWNLNFSFISKHYSRQFTFFMLFLFRKFHSACLRV